MNIFYNKIIRKIYSSNFLNYKCYFSKLVKDKELNLLSSLLLSNINEAYSNVDNHKVLSFQDYDIINKFIVNYLDSDKVKDSSNYHEMLKEEDINFSKMFMSKENNGIGNSYSSLAFLIEKFRSNTFLSLNIIINRLLCSQAILKFGTETQKQKYLSKIAGEQYIGSFCLNECSSGSNIQLMEGIGEYCHKTKILKTVATKNWIYNAQVMNFCILFVKVKNENGSESLSAFLIDKPLETSNVSVTVMNNILNVPNVYKVSFNDACLSAELLGNIGDGFKIANKLQNSARFGVASSLLGIAKQAVRQISLTSELSSAYINDKIIDWTSKLFEVESGVYFTTNIMDTHEEDNFALENAVVKIHASEIAMEVVNDCIDIARESNSNVCFYLDLRNKVRALESFLGSADLLRMFVGGVSLQKIIPHISNDIYKMNHINDNHIWKLKFCTILVNPSSLKTLEIDKNLDSIKYLLNFLQKDIVVSLSESGFDTPNQDFAIWKIASCLVNAYHLLVICGRYKLMEKDSKLTPNAKMVVKKSMDRLRNNLISLLGETPADRISANVYNTKYNAISKIICKNEVHGIESAITRNW